MDDIDTAGELRRLVCEALRDASPLRSMEVSLYPYPAGTAGTAGTATGITGPRLVGGVIPTITLSSELADFTFLIAIHHHLYSKQLGLSG